MSHRSGINIGSLRAQRMAITEELTEIAENFVRKLMLLLFAYLVKGTPRRTGRAQNGWMGGLREAPEGAPPEGQTAYPPPEAPTAEAARFRLGMIAWIVNNVNYIGFLDEGSSQQAPAGMTAVAFANLDAMFGG